MNPGYQDNLIYLEKDMGVFSLVVSDRQENHPTLKKSIMSLMKFIRQIHLEKYLIFVDADVWQ